MLVSRFRGLPLETQSALKGIGGSFLFGVSVVVVGMLLNRTPKNIIPCSSIEALFSPDLILFTTTGACIIQLFFIFVSGSSKTARFFHLKSAELASTFMGGMIALACFLYFDEFGLSYHPLLNKIPAILSTLFILMGMLTYLPMLSSFFLKINKQNFNNGINFYVVTWLSVFSFIGFCAIVFSNEPIATYDICVK